MKADHCTVIDATFVVAKRKPGKNSCLYRIWTLNLCDTGAALYQLSYQANWEQVVELARYKPVKGWWWSYEVMPHPLFEQKCQFFYIPFNLNNKKKGEGDNQSSGNKTHLFVSKDKVHLLSFLSDKFLFLLS